MYPFPFNNSINLQIYNSSAVAKLTIRATLTNTPLHFSRRFFTRKNFPDIGNNLLLNGLAVFLGQHYRFGLSQPGIVQFPGVPAFFGIFLIRFHTLLVRNMHPLLLQVPHVVLELPFMRLLHAGRFLHFMNYFGIVVEPVYHDHAIYPDLFILPLVTGFMDMPAQPHGVALLLALDVMCKQPQLAGADEVIGDFGSGYGIC